MSKTTANWVPVHHGLPADGGVNVLVILKEAVPSDDNDPDERWMEFGTFAPGEGWSGPWLDYLGDGMVVTHWAYRPEFPEDGKAVR